jgi:hypothetical protein
MTNHGLENCISVLRRWASLTDRPLPQDWAAFRQANPSEAMAIESRDSELVALLSGRASASLRADALTGELPATPPDAEAQADAERQARVRFLLEQQPWGRPASYGADGQVIEAVPPSITAQLELSALDPETAAREQAKHRPAPTSTELFEQQERQRQQEAALRFQSLVAGIRR